MQMTSKTNTNKGFAASVLIIDDHDLWREQAAALCSEIFADIGDDLNIVQSPNAEDGLLALTRQEFQVVLLDKELFDINGQHTDGIELIPEILRIQPHVQLLMFTGEDDIRHVVKAMHLGASGYLLKEGKPGHDDYRRAQLRQAFTRARVAIERERLIRTQDKQPTEFIAKSPSMKRLAHHLESLADIPLPVLFLGTTGLGKGAASRQLHNIRAKLYKQQNRPFFNLNIANFTGDLALSELFGHEANSFTGAGAKLKQGYFELANNGDIFLDEIGEASLELQARLLKVIEEREFQRVGGNRTYRTNAKIILATNRDLKEMVADGKFREDLYMRISALTIQLPKLEERKEDIPDLIRVFLSRINSDRSGDPVIFEDLPTDLVDHLMRDDIPGNIRGLQNDLHRIIVFAPKDNRNRPILSSWKKFLGVGKGYVPSIQATTSCLTLEQFRAMQTDFIRPGFTGIQEVREILERKLLEEAEKKLPTNSARAQVLRLNPGHLSRKYNLFKQEKEIASKNESGKARKAEGQYGKGNERTQIENDRA